MKPETTIELGTNASGNYKLPTFDLLEKYDAETRIVSMESVLNSPEFQDSDFDLPIVIGKAKTGEVYMTDLAKIPHLLIAGRTHTETGVSLNAIITSLLYKKNPNELKFVLIDPTKVILSDYSSIAPLFLTATERFSKDPIITDVFEASRTLQSLNELMQQRYNLLRVTGSRSIKDYNKKLVGHQLDSAKGFEYMPYIVVVINDFGSITLTSPSEMLIARLAMLSRAVGIHLVIASNTPTSNIITGTIKANFPGRIAFKVQNVKESKLILDREGAEQLIGRGNLLVSIGESEEPVHAQGAFIDTPEIARINEYIAKQPKPSVQVVLSEPMVASNNSVCAAQEQIVLDPLFEDTAHFIVSSQLGSTSVIQRHFCIGYNRAGRLMEQLEKFGVIGPANGAIPRNVLIQDESQLDKLLQQIHS